MNRAFACCAVFCAVTLILWLVMLSSLGGSAQAVASMPAGAQDGRHTVVFQQGLSPSGYDGTTDTHLDFYAQSRNEGGRVDFGVTFDDKKRALIRFDLSRHIPQGARVLTATLTLRIVGRTASSAMGLLCYQVRQAWSEDEATWLQAQDGMAWSGGPGCDGDSRSENPVCESVVNQPAGGTIDLDLTVVAQHWVDQPVDNQGLLLQGQQVAGRVTYSFSSSEHSTAAKHPILVVVYEGDPPLATPTPTQAPTKTPTPPNPTTIYSTLSDWKFDQCLKTGKDPGTPPRVRTSPAESMLIMWEGTVYTAKLRIVICQTNPSAEHPIYLNGHLVARSPPQGTSGCECSQFPIAPEHQFEFEIDPGIVLQGANHITVTNAADPYEEWKASRGQIILIGDITGTTRSEFELGIDWEDRRLKGAMQLPMGYDAGVHTPLLVSVAGTGEDRLDALNRFAIEANENGWLLASVEKRHVRWSATYEQFARTPSLAVQQDVIDLVDYMQAHYSVDRSRIYIAGFSTGGGIAATLAAKYPDKFAGVLDYSGPTDYAQWYAERPDLYLALQYEFGGGPQGNFEYPRRSSQRLARNLQHVPMRIRHSGVDDTSVPFAQTENLLQAMKPYYDPSQYRKEVISNTVGHADPNSAARTSDLAFLSQFSSGENPSELYIITDEGKEYYWLGVAKAGTANGSWQGWVEVDASYDYNTNTIWLTAGDGSFAEGKPLTITLDLAAMGLHEVSPYDVEEYDWRTGEFFLHTAHPDGGKLILTVPVNALGSVGRQYVIYPATGRVLGYAQLRQGMGGYSGAGDTYIVSNQFPGEGPETSHGLAASLPLGCDWRRKALLSFGLSQVPDDVIVKGARLTLHLLENKSVDLSVGVYESLRPWLDGEATWTFAKQGQSWAVAGAEGVGNDRASAPYHVFENVKSSGDYLFNAKSLVEVWLAAPDHNHGLILIGNGSCSSSTKYPLASAEYADMNKRPLLEVWYMDATPVATVTPRPTRTSTATPTPTRTSTPYGCTIQGSVRLQGRPAAPHQSWSVPLTVTVGIDDHAVTTDQWGRFALSGLAPGIYDIRVKNTHTLRSLQAGATLDIGTNNIDFGTLLEGDANGDNYVNINDFSLLAAGFNPGHDARADFNEDGVVNINDFSLLAANFGQRGDVIAGHQGSISFGRLPLLLK